MKALTQCLLIFLLALPAVLAAEDTIDPAKAIIGTWVLDEEATWARFRQSDAWKSMTPEQQLEFRTTVWPKAQAAILSTAYRFHPDEIIVVVKDKQTIMPAMQTGGEGRTVTYQIGTGPRSSKLIMTFINPNLIIIDTGGGQPNYYVWKRQGK